MLSRTEYKIDFKCNIYILQFFNNKGIPPKNAKSKKCPNIETLKESLFEKTICTLQISKYIKIWYALQEIQYLLFPLILHMLLEIETAYNNSMFQ